MSIGSTNRESGSGLLRRFAALLFLIGLLNGCATVKGQYQAWKEYQAGLDLFRAEKYREAQAHVDTALALLPDRPEFLALRGWTLFKQGRIDEAGVLFSRVHEMDGKSVAGFQGLAWVDYSHGQYDTSEKWFLKQREWATDHMGKGEWALYPESDVRYINSIRSDAAYGLGLIALARGKPRKAEDFLREALAHPNSFTGHAPILAGFGDVCFAGRDYERARTHYEKALALKEDTATAAKRAWCLYHLGDKSGADKVFLRLISSGDRRPGLYGLVFTRHALGRSGEARGYLKELIRLDPYFPDTMDVYHLIVKTQNWRLLWKDFAEAYFERGNFARAAFKLEGYLPLSKQDCAARLMSGWCALHLRGPQEGLDEFTRVSDQKLCPDDQVSTGKGVALLYLNRLDEAGRELEKASRENPGNVRSAVALGAVAFLKGRHEEAVRIYKGNLSRLPKEEIYFSWPSHALNNLGWSYIKTGHYQEAFQTFERLKALHREPVYPEVFDGLGWSLFHLKRFQESKKAFEQALRLAPGNRSSLSGLSSLQTSMKK